MPADPTAPTARWRPPAPALSLVPGAWRRRIVTRKKRTGGRGAVRSLAVFLTIIVVLSALAWTGWSLLRNPGSLPWRSSAGGGAAVSVGTLHAPANMDIRTDAGASVEQALLGNVYETLVTRDDANALRPGMARSWEISGNGLGYTFAMQPGARFSDGRAVTSEDVVRSLQQVTTRHYVGWRDLTAMASVTSPDASTVRIHLRHPQPELLRALSGRAGIVYNPDAGVDYRSTALGSGPFTLERWQAGSPVTLTRNDSYWAQPKAGVRQVTIRYFADSAALVQAVRTGKVDIATPLTPDVTNSDALTSLSDDRKLTVRTGANTRKVILGFNNGTDSILSDKRYRQGIRYTLDNASLMTALAGRGSLLGGPLSRLEPGYENLTGLFPHDPAHGTALLAYFFYLHKTRPLDFVYPERYGKAVGELLREALQPVNVDLHVHMVSDAQWRTTVVKQGKYDFTLFEMGGSPGSLDDLATLVDTDYFIHYTSPQAEQLLAATRSQRNDGEYIKALKGLARQISQDSPVDWLYAQRPLTAYRRGIQGVPVNMTDHHLPLRNVWTAG